MKLACKMSASLSISQWVPEVVRRAILSDADCTMVTFGCCGILSDPNSKAQPEPKDAPIQQHTQNCSFSSFICGKNRRFARSTTIPFDELMKSIDGAASTHQQTEQSATPLAYDVMRVSDGYVQFFADHVHRVEVGMKAITGDSDSTDPSTRQMDAQEWSSVIHPLLQEHISACHDQSVEQNLKIVMWLDQNPATEDFFFVDFNDSESDPSAVPLDGNTRSRNHIVAAFAVYFVRSSYPSPEMYRDGASFAALYGASRTNPNLKIVQAPLRERAKELAKRASVLEVLLVHDDFLVPEGSRSNYLLLKSRASGGDADILCSLEKDILVGITLQAIKRAVAHAGLPAVRHVPLTLGDVCLADGVIMVGTSPGALPISTIVVYTSDDERSSFEEAMHAYAATTCGKDAEGSEDRNSLSIIAARVEAVIDEAHRNNGRIQIGTATHPTAKRLREAYNTLAQQRCEF